MPSAWACEERPAGTACFVSRFFLFPGRAALAALPGVLCHGAWETACPEVARGRGALGPGALACGVGGERGWGGGLGGAPSGRRSGPLGSVGRCRGGWVSVETFKGGARLAGANREEHRRERWVAAGAGAACRASEGRCPGPGGPRAGVTRGGRGAGAGQGLAPGRAYRGPCGPLPLRALAGEGGEGLRHARPGGVGADRGGGAGRGLVDEVVGEGGLFG